MFLAFSISTQTLQRLRRLRPPLVVLPQTPYFEIHCAFVNCSQSATQQWVSLTFWTEPQKICKIPLCRHQSSLLTWLMLTIVMGSHIGSSTVATTCSIFPQTSRFHFPFLIVGTSWRTEALNNLPCKEGKDSYFTYCEYGFTYLQMQHSSCILFNSVS